MRDGGSELLQQLVGEQLSAVTFVQDYLQLEFDPPPRISVHSACVVREGDQAPTFGQPEFANVAIAQIGKKVVAVGEQGESLVITFQDGSRIELPFADGSFDGAEAFVFWGRDDAWGVWPG